MITFFQKIDKGVKQDGHDTEQHDAHEQPIHFKYLAGVNDQIAQAFAGGKKFADDDAHQTKADVDLHVVDDGRDTARQDNLCQYMAAGSVQGVDQLDLPGIHLDESVVQAQDASENGDGHACNDDGALIGSKPYDQKRRQGRFRKAVQNDQIRF